MGWSENLGEHPEIQWFLIISPNQNSYLMLFGGMYTGIPHFQPHIRMVYQQRYLALAHLPCGLESEWRPYGSSPCCDWPRICFPGGGRI